MPDPAQSTGALAAQSGVRRLDLGDVRLTYVTDGAMVLRPSAFFPELPARYWGDHPEALDSRGRVAMSAGGLLVERGDETLLIDVGYGDFKGDTPTGSVAAGALPEVLEALGYPPGRVGAVAFTHLHRDHTGWAFSPGGSPRPGKMFPEARYIMAAQEWAPHERGENVTRTPPEIVEQLAASDLTLIPDGAEVFPGVSALVTPGHTPGHTSYVIGAGDGNRVIALGDIFHVPAQVSHPEWLSLPDVDGQRVPAARRRLLAELERPGTYGFACHFGDQAFGRVVRDQSGLPAWEPVATSLLRPPPQDLD